MSMNSAQEARAITSGPWAHAAPYLSLLLGRHGGLRTVLAAAVGFDAPAGSAEDAGAALARRKGQNSLASRHVKMQARLLLQIADHAEKVLGLRIAARTKHAN